MAQFYLQISSIARAAGRRATAAAAYRSGERIRDERTAEVINFSSRRDVLHTEIFLPSQFAAVEAAWARNRERLWNTAEHAEKRHNSRVAREYQVTLPVELDSARRIVLARAFAQEMADRYKVAVDLAVHEPRADGDARNFHAHLLTTTREVTPTGLGAKVGLDMPPQERRRRGLSDHRQEYVNVRERWAILTNAALREANIDARVDHRSLAAQNIDRVPLPAIPLMHLKMERRGLQSELAERLRADYRDRVARRLEKGAAREGRLDGATAQRVSQKAAAAAAPPQDVEEIKRRAREAWVQLRTGDPRTRSDHSLPDGVEREVADRETDQSRSPSPDDLAL